MPKAHNRETLIKSIEKDAHECFAAGRRNNVTDLTLAIVGILASVVAAVLASTEGLDKWIVAAVAAVPAACTSLQRVVEFRQRSLWYFQFSARAHALAILLKYDKRANLERVAHQRADLETSMENMWSQLGRSGIQTMRFSKDTK
jgi:hypothetical protein